GVSEFHDYRSPLPKYSRHQLALVHLGRATGDLPLALLAHPHCCRYQTYRSTTGTIQVDRMCGHHNRRQSSRLWGQIPSLQRCPLHDRFSSESGSPFAILLCRKSANIDHSPRKRLTRLHSVSLTHQGSTKSALRSILLVRPYG